MSNLRKFRWGFVGGLAAFPAGLTLGGLATKVECLFSLMGSGWFVYKASVVGCVMAGFAIGQALCKTAARQPQVDEATAPSKF
jgi:hypothetical protein